MGRQTSVRMMQHHVKVSHCRSKNIFAPSSFEIISLFAVAKVPGVPAKDTWKAKSCDVWDGIYFAEYAIDGDTDIDGFDSENHVFHPSRLAPDGQVNFYPSIMQING